MCGARLAEVAEPRQRVAIGRVALCMATGAGGVAGLSAGTKGTSGGPVQAP
jgi:hypothetical protein